MNYENYDQSKQKDTSQNSNRIHEHHDHTLLRSLCVFMSVSSMSIMIKLFEKKFLEMQVWTMSTMICESWKSFTIFPCLSMRIMISSFEEHLSEFKLKSWAQWSHIFKRTLLFPQILVRIMRHDEQHDHVCPKIPENLVLHHENDYHWSV